MADSNTAESRGDRGNTQDKESGPGEGISKADIDKINRNIRTLAEAFQSIKADVTTLKRKSDPESHDGSPREKQARMAATDNSGDSNKTQTSHGKEPIRPQSPQPTTSADYSSEVETDEEDIEDMIMLNNDTEQVDDNTDCPIFEDLENFISGQDETGPEVSERMAKIANKALRGKWVKKTAEDKINQKESDEEKFANLRKKHKRPANVENLQIPKADLNLWRQLKRDTKTMDYLQHKAIANYNLAMTPLVKALDLFKNNDQQDTKVGVEYVMDAFKILGLVIKQTVIARRERIKKELLPHMKGIGEEDATATHLFGENLPETIKKLQGTKTSITTTHQQTNSFLPKRGGHHNNYNHNNYNRPRQHQQRGGSHTQQNRYNNKGYQSNYQPGQQYKKKQQQNNHNRK